ncbi:uncharacterized protein LOC132031906 [Lycium ferocissimum]|uniref:uncharacterized protein LOC132031906 n=1 Tax=Lycium ferocissimum TaxID=112874 RepID=UPI002815A154|nr:uncharacterized protein LOC132031906 [Lycium ferocissimum]
MECLSFPDQFITWVMECIQSVNYTILINGEGTEPFDAAKGLRQGDPMSPFLFAIAMEYLSRGLNGLEANLGKSSMYFGGVSPTQRLEMLQLSGFSCGELPFKCLGVPLSTKKLNIMQWQPLILKIVAKISSWTAKKLSYAATVEVTCGREVTTSAKKAQLLGSAEYALPNVWVHLYYIKGQDINTMQIPKQACWMIRKVIEARSTMNHVQVNIRAGKSFIRQVYFQLLGNEPRVLWRNLIFQNAARPKAKFTLWLLMHGRLLTTDRLHKWGVPVDLSCVFCHNHDESREHLFVECIYGQSLWSRLLTWIQRQPIAATG